jgi:hypothetical protein
MRGFPSAFAVLYQIDTSSLSMFHWRVFICCVDSGQEREIHYISQKNLSQKIDTVFHFETKIFSESRPEFSWLGVQSPVCPSAKLGINVAPYMSESVRKKRERGAT